MKEHDCLECISKLSEQKLMDLNEHVQRCAECQASIAGIAKTLLSGTAKRVPIPNGMEDRFMARAAAEGILFKTSRPAGRVFHLSGVLAASACLLLFISIVFSKPAHIAGVREAHRSTAASMTVPQKMIFPVRVSQSETKPRHQQRVASIELRRKDRKGNRISSETIFDASRVAGPSFSSPAFHFAALKQDTNPEALEIAAVPENYASAPLHAFQYDPSISRRPEQTSYAYQNVNWYQTWLQISGRARESRSSFFQ